MVAVAQLVRAPGCGPGGRGFEPPQPPVINLYGQKDYNSVHRGFFYENFLEKLGNIGERSNGQMVEEYRETMELRNYSNSTKKKSIQMIRRFIHSINIPIHQIGTPAVEKYLIEMRKDGKSYKTIDNNISALKGFFDFLIIQGELKINPTYQIKRIKHTQELPVYLPDDEIELLLKLAEQEKILNEVTIALNTGLRMNELRNLQWKDIDIARKQLTVRGEHAKSKKARTVPLNQKAVDAFVDQKQKYEKVQYVFPGGKGSNKYKKIWSDDTMRSYKWWSRLGLTKIKENIPTIAKMSKGITGRGWHIMRHTFATKLAKAGVDILKIKDWMGHTKVETTIQYIHIARKYDPDIELI